MEKVQKIFIIVSPLILLITNLFYGFLIGGKANLVYYLIISTVTILLFRKIIVSKKTIKTIAKLILALILSISINFAMYNSLNYLTANASSEITYQQTIDCDNIYYMKGQRSPAVLFYNSNNELVRGELKKFDAYDDTLKKDYTIKVTEKMGGFHFLCYYIELVD